MKVINFSVCQNILLIVCFYYLLMDLIAAPDTHICFEHLFISVSTYLPLKIENTYLGDIFFTFYCRANSFPSWPKSNPLNIPLFHPLPRISPLPIPSILGNTLSPSHKLIRGVTEIKSTYRRKSYQSKHKYRKEKFC